MENYPHNVHEILQTEENLEDYPSDNFSEFLPEDLDAQLSTLLSTLNNAVIRISEARDRISAVKVDGFFRDLESQITELKNNLREKKRLVKEMEGHKLVALPTEGFIDSLMEKVGDFANRIKTREMEITEWNEMIDSLSSIESLRDLENQIAEIKKIVEEAYNFGSENSFKYIALPNLKNRIEEAIYDALNYFNKLCPYCDAQLFKGTIREKYQIDHFLPIAEGGQHVPWNILPVCKRCNLRKNKKMPQDFIPDEKRRICQDYLRQVRKKQVDGVQVQIDRYQEVKSYLTSKIPNFHQLKRSEAIESLYEIAEIFNLSPERKSLDSQGVSQIKRLIWEDVKDGEEENPGDIIDKQAVVYRGIIHVKFKVIQKQLKNNGFHIRNRNEIRDFLKEVGFHFIDKPTYMQGKLHKAWLMDFEKFKKSL